MPFRLVGGVLLFLSAWGYSRSEILRAKKELAETEAAIELFLKLKSGIFEYSLPVCDLLFEYCGHRDMGAYLSSLTPGLSSLLADAARLGRGYKSEELRLCDLLIEKLKERQSKQKKTCTEVTALSRVKGYGIAAAIIILSL